MKNKILLFLILLSSISFAQVSNGGEQEFDYGIKNNASTEIDTPPFLVSQGIDGTYGKMNRNNVIEYLEFASAVNLPVTGEQGKLYLTKDNNRLYRFNGTIYQELTTDISGKEDKVNKVTSIGSSANDTNYPSELAVKTYADNLVIGMLNDRGTWDASGNVFPTTGGSGVGGVIRKGDMWYVSVAGTLGTKSINVGDSFRALVNDPAQVAANWSILEANIGYVPANDANVVHLTGAETITGVKTFTANTSFGGSEGMFWDNGVKRLGIGTNTPAFPLDIQGSAALAFIKRNSASLPASGKFLFQRTGATFSDNITAGMWLGGFQFQGLVNTMGDYASLAYVANSTTVGDGSLRLYKGDFSTIVFQLNSNSGNMILQTGTSLSDDGINRLQVTGTVSSGTTTLGNTPPTANNQLTRKDYVDTGLALKANLASPALTGTPTAPTAAAGTNTTQIANAAFVTSAISTADSGNVKLTGNQTISGQKSFSLTGKIDMQTDNAFPAIVATSLGSGGQSAAMFRNHSSSPYSSALNLQTGLSGGVGNVTLSVLNQSPIGTGIFSNASNGGVSISSQSGNGDSYISNITEGGTGRNYVGRNKGTETYSVDKIGNVIGNSYIKRSAPANNILLAGGGDIAQNTAFNKNFGTTAGTVVEGNYPPAKDGTGATGTWGISISGSSANSTLWDGLDISSSLNNSAPSGILGYYNSGVTVQRTTSTGLSSFLGLGSNAYTSTAYLPLSGGNISGSVGIGTTTPNRKLEVADIDSQFSLKGSITGAPVYQSWYNSSNVRRGYFGFASESSSDIRLTNEEVGNIYISPNNGSTIVTSTVTATGFFQSSDLRLKNIFKRDGDVAYYTWKDGRDNKQHIGYVAQEVQENHPNQVQADEKGILSVNYVEILVEKIRVLEKRIDQLEKSK